MPTFQASPIKLCLLLTLAFLFNQAANAQTEPFQHGVYGTLGRIGIDQDKARLQGTGDYAIILEAGYYGTYEGLITLKAALYSALIDDKASFSQRVENKITGDRDTQSSSITAWGVAFESGLRFPVKETLSLGGGLGYRSLSADRDIALCSNCRSDDLDLEGGVYLRPYVNIKTRYIDIEISYEEYFTGDYTSALSSSFIYHF